MRPDITVSIDGLPVTVDLEDWNADPNAVTAQVREARREFALSEDQYEPAQTYDDEHDDTDDEEA